MQFIPTKCTGFSSGSVTQTVHPTHIQLCQFVDGLLDGDIGQEVTNHVKLCTSCQKAMALLNIPVAPLTRHIDDVDPEIQQQLKNLAYKYDSVH